MSPAVEARNASFSYVRRFLGRNSRKLALEEVSFCLNKGMVAGMVGHNGAGKTTLLLLLAGIKRPQRGAVRVLDQPAEARDLIRRVGLLTDRFSIYPELRVIEVGRIFGRLFDLPDEVAFARFEEMDLHGHLTKRVRELSSGLRKRLFIAVSTMHDPEIILLDEPFAGLDPESVSKVSELVEVWRDQGKTVIISSHDLHELEQLVDELIVLREGKVLASGGFLDLLRRSGLQPRVRIESTTESLECDVSDLDRAIAEVADAGGTIHRIVTKGTTLADLYSHLHAS